MNNHYGPYDYTNYDHKMNKLPIVEQYHFNSRVKNLQGGALGSGSLTADLNYTLRTFPNHHEALYAMARYQLKNPYQYNQNYYSITCYFQRAMVFQPNDGVINLIYGIYWKKIGNSKNALKQFKIAIRKNPGSSEMHYNLGLLYIEIGDSKLSLEHARKAYDLGYPLPGLKNILTRKGVWK